MKGEMKRWHHDELIHYKKRQNSLILDLFIAIYISLYFKVQNEKENENSVWVQN